MAEIDNLELKITSDSTSAIDGLNKLAGTLDKLKSYTKGGLGLTSVANQIGKIATESGKINGTNINNLKGLATALQTLSGVGNIKISSSIANQLTAINTALGSLNVGSGNAKIQELVTALQPLETIGKSNLGSVVSQLKKFPEVMQGLNNLNMGDVKNKMQELANAMKPLADEMQKVANGFSAFPNKLQKLLATTNSTTTANNALSKSYVNLYAKFRMAYMAIKGIASGIAKVIKLSNDYVEDLNLFNASMGQYATEAQKYAEQVGEIMGIDPGEWMRSQGVFMTLATGFGVVSDRAYKMSKNLTQLGYDLSSFFNISTEDAMLKLQSGLAGELEPLRRIGFDLSVARLQQEAYTLGIDKKIAKMTQAEKAELRYHAILTQVTVAQGDMARTLNAPANQLRIFKAQVTQAGRAIGNIFIPALNAILPVAIAVIKVIRLVAQNIAELFGFELPEVDYSGLNGMASGAEDVADALDGATDSAKKLKQYTMGFDELNVINPDSGNSGGSDSALGGSGFDFELPEYDFLGGLAESKSDEIFKKIKERLGEILNLVVAIGGGLLAWAVTKGFIDAIASVKTLLANPTYSIAIGVILTLTGFMIEFGGLKDAVENGLDGFNFGEIVGGALLGTAGATILGTKIVTWIGKVIGTKGAFALAKMGMNIGVSTSGMLGAVLGASISGIIAGIPAYFVGIYDACKKGLNWLNGLLIPLGSTMAGAGIGAIIGMLGGPIGAGIGALVGLAVGALTDGIIACVQNWESIKTFFTETVPTWFSKVEWSKIGEFIGHWLHESLVNLVNPFGAIIRWLEDVFDFEINWKNIGEAIGKGFGKAVKFLGEAWSFCDEWLRPSSLFKKLVHFVQEVDWAKVGETVKNCAVKAFDIGKDILGGIVKGFKDGWNDFWKDVKDFISGFVKGFKEELGIHSPSTVFVEIAKDIVLGLIQGVKDFFSDTKESIVVWATNVKNWFTGGDGNGNIFEKFMSYGSSITSNLLTGVDGGVVQEKYEDIFERITKSITATKDNIKGVVNTILSFIESLANGVIKGINTVINGLNKLKIDVPEWVTEKFGITDFGFNIPTLDTISIPRLATGGFPDTGQMFIAREAGAELVGNIGRKTAVVNNEQIVASVSRGVADANSEQNSLLREQNTLLRALLDKETATYLDGKKITANVEKHQRERGRVLVTGGAY